MKILHLDNNHPILKELLATAGYTNHEDFTSSKQQIEEIIDSYDGIVVRSRFPLDTSFLSKAKNLKVIGRVGAGLENIDTAFAKTNNIACHNAPEGNRNAVGEHTLGMLLSLFNKLNKGDREVRSGVWDRENNRGLELDGKTVGIIGYGNMGNAFSKKLRGFDCEVLCYDLKQGVGNENARQVSLQEFQKRCDVVSLHVPHNQDSYQMIDAHFVAAMEHPFWLLNTARGSCVVTQDLVNGLKAGKILGAGLDVLEFEKASFENFFTGEMPIAFQELLKMEHVLLSPHVAGWTIESKKLLARVIAEKMIATLNTY